MEHTYQFGYPQSNRIMELRDKCGNSKETFSVEYQGKYRQLPVIEVRIELPVYRIENVRTVNLQKEFLATHQDMQRTLFTSDPYSIEPQETQHQLLKSLISQENLLDAFKNGSLQQTEPLICSDDGIIVNGNRRLCVWRELYYQDKEAYKHFQTIRVAVLPDHDPQGMQNLEVSLQIQSPMKADYAWHAVAAMVKNMAIRGIKIGIIANSLKLSPKEINEYIGCYDYAEQYLIDIGCPDQWSKVDNSEYALKEIIKGRKTLNDPGEKELFNEIAMAMLSKPAKGDRLYALIPKIAPNLEKITEKLEQVLNIEIDDTDEDDTELLFGEDDHDNVRSAKVATAVKVADESLIVDTVRNVIKSLDELESEKKNQTFIFDQVTKAATLLNNALSNLNDGMSKTGIEKQLDTIERDCKLLMDWIKR